MDFLNALHVLICALRVPQHRTEVHTVSAYGTTYRWRNCHLWVKICTFLLQRTKLMAVSVMETNCVYCEVRS